MNNGVRGNNTARGGIRLDDFELYSSHASANDEGVALVNWTISFEEVGLQVNFKPISVEDKCARKKHLCVWELNFNVLTR